MQPSGVGQQAAGPAAACAQEHVLEALGRAELAAVQEVHARLLALYPQYRIAHMPADQIQGRQPSSDACGAGTTSTALVAAGAEAGGADVAPGSDCAEFVANAAVAGDAYSWHIDADPVGMSPNSPGHP